MFFILERAFESTLQHSKQPAVERLFLLVVLLGLAFFKFRILYRVFLYPRFFSPLRSIPGPPLGHPIYGQVITIIKGEAGIPHREWVKKYGPVVRVVGPIGIEHLIFMKPEAMQKILVSDWIDYPRPKFVRDIMGLVVGHGLFTTSGNDHKQMRKTLNPAFSIPNLMAQSDMYYRPIEGLIDILRTQINSEKNPSDGKEVPIYTWLSKVTLDIICETAFGYQSDSLHNSHNDLAEEYKTLLRPTGATMVALLSIPGATRLIASEWAYKHRDWFAKSNFTSILFFVLNSMHRIRKISAEILQNKLRDSAILASVPEHKRDIMSILARSKKSEQDSDAGGYAMSNEALIDQVLTFLGAGHETTASGLAWTLWLLAKDPKSQERLRAEVAPLFADNPRPDYRTLKDLQWLDCVIQESLRLMPPVPMTFRTAFKTGVIDGILVPAGTILSIQVRAINTWKKVWGDDAEEFNPSRWLNLPPTYDSSFSCLSFLSGPHACIGKTKAITEMKAVLGSLIANFQFEPAYVGQVPRPTTAITMRPKDNMPLRVCIVPTSS